MPGPGQQLGGGVTTSDFLDIASKKEFHLSKTWEHYHHAARHHEKAAYHFNEAAKYDQAEEQEKAAHHAYLAHGHSQHAIHHDAEAAKLHAEQCDSRATPASAPTAKKNSAA